MHDLSKIESEQGTFFTGVGDLTCHRFIRSVREHAIEAEKQTDDRWMADHASVRFDDDALEWFESLDDETQTDWKRLRRAILARYSLPAYGELTPADQLVFAFSGKNKDERRSFVHEIRRRAFQEGKENDSDWMVRLAFPCFMGEALEWHASLLADVRANWSLLERAILIDYPNSAPMEYTLAPLESFSPARIRVNDWSVRVPPSPSMNTIRSKEDWLAQAEERRRMYQAQKNESAPCWLLVEQGQQIPKNAIRTGCEKSQKPLFSARAWYGDKGLIVGKCGHHISGAYIPLNGEEIGGVLPFEVLVGDPSHFYWVAGPDRLTPSGSVKHRPLWGMEAGLDLSIADRATFIAQVPCDNGRLPGKLHSLGHCAHGCTEGREVTLDAFTARVLAWAD
ncbi:hypothetical protein FRC04_001190 [Tulasnella sp. 424]|nr:hypothetical protein FRC04_001190 [Tulasnella sp. 424]KAG8975791.1 hypothetical protein FRC05_005001 [Tulasnella sp. 425]